MIWMTWRAAAVSPAMAFSQRDTADPRAAGRGVLDVDMADPQRRPRDRGRGGGADRRDADLGDRPPGLALAAPTHLTVVQPHSAQR